MDIDPAHEFDAAHIKSRQPLYIPATPYAPSYASHYTIPEGNFLTPEELKLLAHVNCSYLSSNKAPTLLALKQHAQALAILIQKLSISSCAGPVDAENLEDVKTFYDDEAFDWLGNLSVPYENDDEYHHIPLWSIASIVKEEREGEGLEHRCPLEEAKDFGSLAEEDGERRPYMTHHNLVMHANECLEILDHEYGATGGLMSLLPTEHEADTEQLEAARNTLLGQWLLHHQHLVGRMHELEINYANALDVLADEASVPLQITRRMGPDGMATGREVAYPQDKYVLVNAGDEITEHIHRVIDRAEAQIEQKEKMWKASGVTGERLWMRQGGGDWYSRGLVPVDLLTRFYRVKEKGSKSTIFMLPAIEQHPRVAHTQKMEQRPTVVSVVTPTWPERVSDWELKFKAKLDRATQTEIVNQRLIRERLEMLDQLAVKDSELEKNAGQLAAWERSGEGEEQQETINELESEIRDYESKMRRLRRELPREYHRLLDPDPEEPVVRPPNCRQALRMRGANR